jgi:hypothetical protein
MLNVACYIERVFQSAVVASVLIHKIVQPENFIRFVATFLPEYPQSQLMACSSQS